MPGEQGSCSRIATSRGSDSPRWNSLPAWFHPRIPPDLIPRDKSAGAPHLQGGAGSDAQRPGTPSRTLHEHATYVSKIRRSSDPWTRLGGDVACGGRREKEG